MARKEHPQGKGAEKRSAKKVAVKPKLLRGVMRAPNFEGVAVVFKALYPEMLGEVPDNLRASDNAKIKFYRELVRVQQAAKAAGKDCSAIGVDVPWNMLDFCPEVGREPRCDLGNVANIVGNFQDNMYANPRIAALPVLDSDGNITTVRFLIADAWHRRTAKLELYYRDKPELLRQVKHDVFALACEATPCATIGQVAQMFTAQNDPKLRKPVRSSNQWRPRAVAGALDPRAQTVIKVAAKYGFNAKCQPNAKRWNDIHNGATIENLIYKFVGQPVVERAFGLISDPTLVGVHKHKEALSGAVFGGLCVFIARMEEPGFAHDAGIRHLMTLPTFMSTLLAAADTMSKDTIPLYIPKAGSLSRDENKRFMAHAAAIVQMYKLHVPEPKTRGKFWAKCPAALRELMHVAPLIEDDVKRNNFVAERQRKLDDAKYPCFSAWRKQHIKPLTR